MIDDLSTFNLSDNFPYAITLPENVTPPMKVVIIINTYWKVFAGRELNSDHAIKKVANPPKPLNKATISGIEVIFTFKAIKDPIIAPIPIPIRINNGLITFINVIETAINIAKAERKLPFTAVSSLPNIFIPVINNIEEAI